MIQIGDSITLKFTVEEIDGNVVKLRSDRISSFGTFFTTTVENLVQRPAPVLPRKGEGSDK